VSATRGAMGAALARAAGWLVEPAAPQTEAATRAPGLTVLTFESAAPTKQDGCEPQKRALLPVRAEPHDPTPTPVEPPPRPAELPLRAIVAIVGLAPACGATTLARALAATLARRDHSGTAIVAGTDESVGSQLAARGAARLAGRLGSPARAAGRLCLTRPDHEAVLAGLAPLVLDLAPDSEPVSRAHLTILVAPGDSEPALAELAVRRLAHGGTPPLIVVSGASDDSRWHDRAFLLLPRSRIGARLAAAGWEPRGAYGAAVARIADSCEEAACA
jgi:hypothetical protein